ncbi:hypothetical protein V5E97_33945 [Singulisphaera sp. Ch08]|uniref:Uncharacterized protein n=1 Tax=Singulisphaera sp. Ch08 TaxID=3120278 RepID=A0AAU7CD75_9BACT
MMTERSETPRWRWPVVFAILALFGGGCTAMGTADREAGSGTTLSTDPATVKPGQTIAPPSLGIDLSRSSIDNGRGEAA